MNRLEIVYLFEFNSFLLLINFSMIKNSLKRDLEPRQRKNCDLKMRKSLVSPFCQDSLVYLTDLDKITNHIDVVS